MGKVIREGQFRFGAVAVAIGIVCLCVTILAALWCGRWSNDHMRAVEQQRLAELSTVFANQIDTKRIAKLQRPADAVSNEYDQQLSQLERLRKAVPELAECFVIRLQDSSSRVLLDTGRGNDAVKNSIHERYELMEEFTPLPSEALIANLTGRVQVASEPVRQFGREVRRAYAPIVDSQNKPIAILVLSLPASPGPMWVFDSLTANFPIATEVAALLALVVWLFLRRTAGKDATGITRVDLRPRIVKWMIADCIFIAFAIATVVGVRYMFFQQQNAIASLRASDSRQITLEQSISVSKIENVPQIKHQLTRESAIQSELRSQLDTFNRFIVAGFVAMCGLALGALFALRVAFKTHLRLQEAQEDAEWHRSQHEQLIEGLPIGFYAAESSKIVFSNSSMDLLMGRNEGQDIDQAFKESLLPADVDGVVDVLKRAENAGHAFDFTFRFGRSLTDARIIETRGVPIFDAEGNPSRTVAFAMDVTAQMRAQNLAERRQHEAEEANRMLRKALEDGETNFEATVYALVKAVEAKDVYTAGHSERVMDYSVRIGRALGLNETQMRTLRMGTLIHDVGKIGIPDSILSKPDRLTQEEFALIKQHPEIGVRMIEGIPAFRDCIPIVLYHHERLDGRGYPFGLTAESIPLLVRISTVADCFDAMTSDRAYRKGRNAVQALGDLAIDAEKGSLDGKIVETLADIVLSGEILRLERAA